MQNLYDDVSVGDLLPTLDKGPLTIVHLVRWAGAIENWHRIHYDRSFAVTHDGLPDVLVHGSLKQQFIMQLLKDWAGPEGWAWKTRFQFRAMDPVGSVLRLIAKVIAKYPLENYGMVELEFTMVNEVNSRESARGNALIALPFKEGGAVPYPFRAPRVDPWSKAI